MFRKVGMEFRLDGGDLGIGVNDNPLRGRGVRKNVSRKQRCQAGKRRTGYKFSARKRTHHGYPVS